MSKVFLINNVGEVFSYSRLLNDLATMSAVPHYLKKSDLYEVFITVICSIVHEVDLVLLDHDFSDVELSALGIEKNDLLKTTKVEPKQFLSVDEMLQAIETSETWKLTLYTSGTTGLPKSVQHKLSNLTRLVRKSSRQADNIWAFAYNPTHIAGIQVFFQALLNGNTMVDVFDMPKDYVLKQLKDHEITNISATPTFYRMLLPIDEEYPKLRRITSGGERFDANLINAFSSAFPNAKLRNIYASTEAGSVLESKNDVFSISDPTMCKVEDGRLFIHKSLLGMEDWEDEWYDTGDLVEYVDSRHSAFRIISRESEMINVGGYKVNPLEVEEALLLYPAIDKAKVWGKANPIVGNILMADVVLREVCKERDIRTFLGEKLQDFKVPRIINFVDDIEVTRSGKIKR